MLLDDNKNYRYSEKEIEQFVTMWNGGESLEDIAQRFRRTAGSVPVYASTLRNRGYTLKTKAQRREAAKYLKLTQPTDVSEEVFTSPAVEQDIVVPAPKKRKSRKANRAALGRPKEQTKAPELELVMMRDGRLLFTIPLAEASLDTPLNIAPFEATEIAIRARG